MSFTTAIFDMDGVVIDSEVLFDRADSLFFANHNVPHNVEEVKHMLTGMDFTQAVRLLKETYGFEGSVEDLARERSSLLESLYLSELEYVPGFLDFHRALKERSIKTCIATACNPAHLELVHKKLGLFTEFQNNIYKIADVGYKSKPDPAIFLYAAEQMGSHPSECFVLEDAPKGIEAAKRADMFCVGLTTTFPAPLLAQSDIIVDAFADLALEELGV
jgi:HAD superfamily hydrolase (TIGR01509 family)